MTDQTKTIEGHPQSSGMYILTLLDDEILRSLPNWRDYFELSKYSLARRKRAFDKIPGLVKERTVQVNLNPSVGLRQLAKALSNNIAGVSEITVNYSALGTGVTAPAAGDTQLQTETFRKTISSVTYGTSDTKFYATAFYTAPETSGTFREVGLFINGTGTANSGTLWSRAAINVTKALTESLTVDYIDTFTSS